MLRVRVFVILACVLLASILHAGCLERDDDVLDPFLTPRPRGFHAEVQHAEGAVVWVNLSGPVPVRPPQGPVMQAYLLEKVNAEGDGPPTRQSWFLDDRLRIVANVWGCGLVFGPCGVYEYWLWGPAGDLAPMGLGYPDHLAAGTLDMRSGSKITPLDATTKRVADDRLEISTRLPAHVPESYAGPFTYTAGRMLPDAPTWTVVSYRETDVLERPDELLPRSKERFESPGSEAGRLLFPDEDADHFDVGATHVEIMEEAFPEHGDPTTCITHYHLALPRNAQYPLMQGASELLEKEITATAEVRQLHDGIETTREVTIYRDRVTNQTTMMTEGRTRSEVGFTCPEVARSPVPTLEVDAALTFARSIVPSNEQLYFEVDINQRSAVALLPEDGWHTFAFGFMPDRADDPGGLYDAYSVVFDAYSPPRLIRAVVPPGSV